MKILFFIESLGCGGAERSLVSLLQSLDYEDLEVDLLLLRDDSPVISSIPKQVNILVKPLDKGVFAKLSHLIYALRWRWLEALGQPRHKAEVLWSCKGMTQSRLRKEYDVAIAYQQGFPTYYVATRVMAKSKVAWINVDLQKAGYRPDFNRKYYDLFDRVVTVSTPLKITIAQYGYVKQSSLQVIYDPLDCDMILSMAKKKVPVAPRVPGRLSIVTVGRLERQKNYNLAVKAANHLRFLGLDFVWTFVGDGSERAAIEDSVMQYGLEDNVRLVGYQANPYPFVQAADIYVQTSLFEGFGLAIAEAKILSVPVVSTDFNVVTDQIEDGVNGLIAEMNYFDVADKILRLVNDRVLYKNIKLSLKREMHSFKASGASKFNTLIRL